LLSHGNGRASAERIYVLPENDAWVDNAGAERAAEIYGMRAIARYLGHELRALRVANPELVSA
jgi:hypothetical protein